MSDVSREEDQAPAQAIAEEATDAANDGQTGTVDPDRSDAPTDASEPSDGGGDSEAGGSGADGTTAGSCAPAGAGHDDPDPEGSGSSGDAPTSSAPTEADETAAGPAEEADPRSPQKLPMARSAVRALIKYVPDLMSLVAVLAGIAGLLQIAILLWALSNRLRQGLDDLAARSVVRRTR